jgi:hypothetical protein
MAQRFGPIPTFSPSRDQPLGAPDDRLECEIDPTAAMCAAQPWALALSVPSVE